jgi:sugar phosphate isomerase/epimerase
MTTSRRTFLGAMTGAVAAGGALPRLAGAAGAGKPPLGLQLWSVRNDLEKDVPGTLARIKAWGIDEVESFGSHGASLAPALRDAGLRCRAIHVGYDRLSSDIEGALSDADALGAGTIVNPSLPRQGSGPASREEIEKAAADFARWAEVCRSAGKRFGYHVHGQEFGAAPEGTLFDVLARGCGTDVGFEADVYWITFGGADPVAFLRKHAGRVWFTHLKDMAKGIPPGDERAHADEANVALGTGQMDIAGIVAAGRDAGVELNYIEDESAQPFVNIPRSVAFYRGL